MTREVIPLTLASVTRLPERARRCVAWELEPRAGARAHAQGQAEFEKEVWLSGVLLTWGTAGQLVILDGEVAAFAFYAPPTVVPAVGSFPTAPVSPDAVLLTTAHVRLEQRGGGLGRELLAAVITDLTRRGVRAVEAFGRSAADDPEPFRGQGAQLPENRRPEPLREGEHHPDLAEDGMPRCVLPAGFLRANGFTVVGPHHRYPRLRLELSQGLAWRAGVEAALDALLAEAAAR